MTIEEVCQNYETIAAVLGALFMCWNLLLRIEEFSVKFLFLPLCAEIGAFSPL